MYIHNIGRSKFSVIKNSENNESNVKPILNGVTLSCYNKIVDFIKPNSNIRNNFQGLKNSISNIENKNNQSEMTTLNLDNKENK